MNLQRNFKTVALSLVSVCALQTNATELVKTCQEFKKSFLEACQLVGEEHRTEKMKFLQDNINLGGSIIFFEVITVAIDDCIHALTNNLDTAKTKDIIAVLKTFKNQINSNESYDLATGAVFKRETLRSGKTRTTKVPYDARRCYSIATEKADSDKEE